MQTIETLSRAELARTDPDTATAAIEYGMGLLSSGEFPHLSAQNEQPPGTAADIAAMPGTQRRVVGPRRWCWPQREQSPTP